MPDRPLRIGTRRSPLAMAQAREVALRLEALGVEAELVEIVTSGDKGAHPSSSPAGLKGLFVAEIVTALQNDAVDLAVHSAKDLPAEDPSGVVVAAIPERASPFDVLVSREASLSAGARVGSSSLRRRGQLLRTRPYEVVDVRGNVDTRLRKMRDGEVDGLVLAEAGLSRLRIVESHSERLDVDEMVPAPGQGALAVQTREDTPVREIVAHLDDRASRLAFEAERTVVRMLGGGCALPLGAYAEASAGEVRLVAVVLRPDGTGMLRAEAHADSSEAAARQVVEALRAEGADQILADLQ
jgi:hydroxymethylbilane synthase